MVAILIFNAQNMIRIMFLYALVHIIGQNRPSLTGVRVKPLIFLFMAAILKNGGHLDLFEWLTGFYLILWPD